MPPYGISLTLPVSSLGFCIIFSLLDCFVLFPAVGPPLDSCLSFSCLACSQPKHSYSRPVCPFSVTLLSYFSFILPSVSKDGIATTSVFSLVAERILPCDYGLDFLLLL